MRNTESFLCTKYRMDTFREKLHKVYTKKSFTGNLKIVSSEHQAWSKLFIEEKAVFKIGKDGMVTTYKDFLKKESIEGNFDVPLIYRLASTASLRHGNSPKIFLFRELYKNEWKEWFIAN